MKILFLILFFVSCGKKEIPKTKEQLQWADNCHDLIFDLRACHERANTRYDVTDPKNINNNTKANNLCEISYNEKLLKNDCR